MEKKHQAEISKVRDWNTQVLETMKMKAIHLNGLTGMHFG